ncbi:MAG TPA: DUF3857 and transglutaminase domain-containing protein [Pyrinomonadaceae bacterium]|jgi:hypothetical protein
MKFPRTCVPFFYILVLLVFTATTALAGDNVWKPIDPAELALKAPVVEKDADAEALFWEVRLEDKDEYQGDLVFQHYIRIKVFTERGRESQSKIDIPFGKFYGSNIKIKDIAGRTVKADGTIVELKKEDIFERTVARASGVKAQAKSFAMPSVEPGAIIEYRWREVRSNQSANYVRLQFQRDIPAQNITYYIKPLPGSMMHYEPFQMENNGFQKDKNGFHKMTVTNVPAYHEEPRMPPEDSVRRWMLVYYTRMDLSRIPLLYWQLWGSIIAEVHKSDLKVNDDVKRAVAEAVGSETVPEKKLERIFNYVRSRIKNIYDDASGLTAEERAKVKTNKSPADTLKRAQGTSEDVDMLFATMAIAAGFDARVVEMADRSNVFFNINFANGYFMRLHAIAVKMGENWNFYDPSSAYVPFGMLAWKKEGQQGLVLDAKSSEFVTTPLSPPEKSKEKRTAKLTLSEDGTLEGDVRMEYHGQAAADKKEYNDDDSPTERETTLQELIKAQMSTAEVSQISIENTTDPVKPFVYAFHIRVPGYAQRTGKRLFLQPAFFQHGHSPLFPTSTRLHPIYFSYPWSEEDEVTIDLPAGFTLDNPDAPAPLSANELSRYEVKIMTTKDQRKLVYKRNFFFGGGGKDMSRLYYPATSYGQLKTYFDMLHKRDSHTITLKQETTAATTTTAPAQ